MNANLASLTLSNLQHEPLRLSKEVDRCNSELEALVMDNYHIFIENLTYSVELRDEDAKLSKVFASLGQHLDDLSTKCSGFRDRVSSFISNYKRNRKTLQHHMQLVELLEVPQLVDACARNGFHDEALELANFVNGLERRHLLAEGLKDKALQAKNMTGSDNNDNTKAVSNASSVSGKMGGNDVIQSIVNEVHSTLLSLRKQLVQLLSEESSLPKELQTLASLRKLNALLIDRQLALERHHNPYVDDMTDESREMLRQHYLAGCETRLQMEFLEARTLWIRRCSEDTLSSTVSNNNLKETETAVGESESDILGYGGNSAGLGPYGKAVELLERNRSSWFGVITQYKALFGDNDDDSGSHISSSTSHNASISSENGKSDTSTSVLSAWVVKQVNTMLLELESHCQRIVDGQALRTILEQALYFSNRIGDVGGNFNPLIIPIFKSLIMSRVHESWTQCLENWQAMVKTERYYATNDGAVDKNLLQVVPLFVRQQSEMEKNDNNPLQTPIKNGVDNKISNNNTQCDELAAPRTVLQYPPLTYLLNMVLQALNFVRECPLMTLKDDMYQEMQSLLVTIVDYFIEIKDDLQKRGHKYLSHSKGIKGTTGKNGNKRDDKDIQKNEDDALDTLYAKAMMLDLFPHLLYCLDGVFGTPLTATTPVAPTQSGTPAAITKKKIHNSFSITRLLEAQNKLSKASHVILRTCWQRMEKAGYRVEAPLPPSPFSSISDKETGED